MSQASLKAQLDPPPWVCRADYYYYKLVGLELAWNKA